MNYVSVELETWWLNCGSIILARFSMAAYTVHFRFEVEPNSSTVSSSGSNQYLVQKLQPCFGHAHGIGTSAKWHQHLTV